MQGYIELLKENYYVIAVTLDGCDGSGNSYTSKDEVTDKVLQKVKELDVDRIRLLYGLSMGGANALNFLYKSAFGSDSGSITETYAYLVWKRCHENVLL